MADKELLEEAIQPTLHRIRADRRRVAVRSPRVAGFLETIEERFRDPGFDVNALWRKHGIRDKNAASWFSEALEGQNPKAYLTDCRLGPAARLIQHTRLRFSRVAKLCGYNNTHRAGHPPH